MYRAHFEYDKQEPLKMFFKAEEKPPVKMEFEAPRRQTIKFLITEDMRLEVK